ncbi:MAG: CadD family cadmium resistance transporter [Anaerolineaceae bacterium]
MLATIFTAIATYVATSIDYLIILVIFFSREKGKNQIKSVVLGQYLGTGALVIFSLLIAFGFSFIPRSWIIGLLGLIPIALGLKVLFKDDEEEEENEVMESAHKFRSLVLSLTALTIASGGDNIGIYVPLFSSITSSEIKVTVVVYFILVAVLCYISNRIANIKYVGETIEKYERIIVPIVFIGLGIMILIENGTFSFLLSLLG